MLRGKNGLVVLCTAFCVQFAIADEPVFKEPILLTSAGQSADVLLMKALLNKDSVQYVYEPKASETNLENISSIVIVLGGSSKGLGAAKISVEDEKARVQKLLAAAKKKNIPVLAVHLGGVNRRGALSDDFNKLGAENANRIIVVKGGNEDGLFTGISERKEMLIETAEKIVDVGPIVKNLYKAEPIQAE